MKSNKKRKEALLDKETLEIFELKAKRTGRNLKNYMEFVLNQEAYAFEPSEDYKAMMDKMIDNHKKGITNYISEAEFRKGIIQ
ncbi:MAG: hypothetical protein ACJA1H_000420 [Glaciecola sp.]|jgi:hypothetical protein